MAATNDQIDVAGAVQAAFGLGWQVSRLHASGCALRPRPPQPGPHAAAPPPARPTLPGLSDLPADRRTEMGLDAVDAALVRIAPVLRASRIAPPATSALHRAFADGVDRASFRAEVRTLHLALLRALSAADPRLGKAYTLGRSLHELHGVTGRDALVGQFKRHRILGLCHSLEDLRSWFPRHAALAVAGSLRDWMTWVDANGGEDRDWDERAAGRVHDVMLNQGELWRGLLTGDQCGEDLLRTKDYVAAAVRLAEESQRVAGQIIRRYALTLAVAVALIAGAVVAAALIPGTAEVVASVAAVAAAVGITWKGVGSSLAHLAGELRRPLWMRQLDTAVVAAVDRLPRDVPIRPLESEADAAPQATNGRAGGADRVRAALHAGGATRS